jgi:WD40 repeat protein
MKSPDPVVITNGESIWDAKFSPDSQWFVCSGTGAVEIRDVRSAALIRRLPMNQFVTRVDISPDGRRVVACGVAGQTTVWDALTGAPLFPSLAGTVDGYVEFSRDGRRFLVASGNATVEVHDTESGRQFGPTLTNTSTAVAATFSLSGDSLVVGTDNGTIEFWSIPEGIRQVKPAHHKDVVWTARLSPDGKQLLTASRDRTAALWDAESGRLVREFRHEQQVYNAAFSPDGERIVTGGASRKAYLWDARTGQLLFSLPAHPGGVWYGEFSSDGRVLLTGDDAGNARLWEGSSGLPLSGWVHNGSSLKRVHLSPDGRMALSASNDGTVRLWPVLLAPLPAPTWLADLAEAVASPRLRGDGAPEPVPAEALQTLRTSLLSREDNNDFYTRWLHWFFVERLNEKPSEFK